MKKIVCEHCGTALFSGPICDSTGQYNLCRACYDAHKYAKVVDSVLNTESEQFTRKGVIMNNIEEYYSISFDVSILHQRIKEGLVHFKLGDYTFPNDVDKIIKDHMEDPDNVFGLMSFTLMRAEQLIMAAFITLGLPYVHEYMWPDGSFYIQTKSKCYSAIELLNRLKAMLLSHGLSVLEVRSLSDVELSESSGDKTCKDRIDIANNTCTPVAQ